MGVREAINEKLFVVGAVVSSSFEGLVDTLVATMGKAVTVNVGEEDIEGDAPRVSFGEEIV